MLKRAPLPPTLYLQFLCGTRFYLRLSICKYTIYNDDYLQSWFDKHYLDSIVVSVVVVVVALRAYICLWFSHCRTKKRASREAARRANL